MVKASDPKSVWGIVAYVIRCSQVRHEPPFFTPANGSWTAVLNKQQDTGEPGDELWPQETLTVLKLMLSGHLDRFLRPFTGDWKLRINLS